MANSAFNHEPSFTIPGSTTDNAVIRWDGTSGAGQQNSGILIDDSDNLTVPGYLYLSGDEKELRFYEGANYVAIKTNASLAGNYTLTLPLNDGGSGEYLQTNGSGVLTWAAAGGAVSAVANGADNRIATFSSSDALNGEASLTFDSCDLKLSKTGAPEIHLEGTTIPRLYVTAYSSAGNAPEISLRRSDNATLGSHAAVDGCDILGYLSFVGSDGDSYHTGAYIRGQATQSWSNTNYGGQLQFYTTEACAASPTLRLSLKCSGEIRIPAAQINLGDDTNTKMTTGITINQGTSDDQILSFKSSDVNHPHTDENEVDTYASFKKYSSKGGLKLIVDQECTSAAFKLIANVPCGCATTTKSAGGGGMIGMSAGLFSGSGSKAMSADANMFIVQNDGSTRFIIDEDGDVHYDGSTNASAWDEYCDVELLTATRAVLMPAEADFKNRFRTFVNEYSCILEQTGVVTLNRDTDSRPFVSTKGLNGLIIDSIRQVHGELQEVKNQLKALQEGK